jgi:hypothetical protein
MRTAIIAFTVVNLLGACGGSTSEDSTIESSMEPPEGEQCDPSLIDLGCFPVGSHSEPTVIKEGNGEELPPQVLDSIEQAEPDSDIVAASPEVAYYANSYGGPMAAYKSGPELGSTCPEGAHGAQIGCTGFVSCASRCTTAAECEAPPMGSAVPECRSGQCRLTCGSEARCPDGMICVQTSGAACYWPVLLLTEEGCP